MSDLIERLRDTRWKNKCNPSLQKEAADRIEELEARMERIADRAESLGEAQWIAHNSLAALKDQT